MINVTLLVLVAAFVSTCAFPPEFWAKKLIKIDVLRNMILDLQKLHDDHHNLHKDIFKMPKPIPNNDKPLLPVLTWEDQSQTVPAIPWIVPPPSIANPVPVSAKPWEIQPQPLPTWIFPHAPAPVMTPEPFQPVPLPVWPEMESLEVVPLGQDLFKDFKLEKDFTVHQLPPLPLLSFQKNCTKNIVIGHVHVPTATSKPVPSTTTPVPTAPVTTPPCSTTTTTEPVPVTTPPCDTTTNTEPVPVTTPPCDTTPNTEPVPVTTPPCVPCVATTTTTTPGPITTAPCVPCSAKDKQVDIQVYVDKHVS